MESVYLYGSGKRCCILIELLENSFYEIAGIVDTDVSKWGLDIEGYIIQSPEILKDCNDSLVCVTFYSSLVYEPVWNNIEQEYGIIKSKIIGFHDMLIRIYEKQHIMMKLEKKNQKGSIIFDGSWKLGLGGVESWLKEVVTGLINSNNENIYLLTQKEQDDIPLAIRDNVLDFNLKNESQFSEEGIRYSVDTLLNNLPCTVVFSRVDEVMLAAYLIKKKYPDKINIIMADHGSCDGMYRDILSYKEGIDYYVPVSSGIRDELILRGIDKNRIQIMTCPVKYEKFHERKYTLNKNYPIQVGYAGRLEIFEKRMDILMKVILELEKMEVNYHFNIAGDGTQFHTIGKFIEAEGLSNKVVLLGKIENAKMGEFWIKQDIAINTSDNEGRPLANMEAMINGVVPIVTNTIGIRDDVIDEVNGCIVPLEDAVKMAERISYFDKNRGQLEIYGMAAKNSMVEKSSMEKHICMWTKILNKVMENRDEISI